METMQLTDVMTMTADVMDRNDTKQSLAEIMIEAGYMLGCAGQYGNAERIFRSIIAVFPKRIGGWLGLGNVLLMQGQIEESEEAYETVLENDPSDPAARAFLGELYLCSGRYEAGREILSSVFHDYPDMQVGAWAWNLLQLSGELQK